VKTAALVTGALIALAAIVIALAVRGLRKFVRSVWPHS
jgi:hypothetical protein